MDNEMLITSAASRSLCVHAYPGKPETMQHNPVYEM